MSNEILLILLRCAIVLIADVSVFWGMVVYLVFVPYAVIANCECFSHSVAISLVIEFMLVFHLVVAVVFIHLELQLKKDCHGARTTCASRNDSTQQKQSTMYKDSMQSIKYDTPSRNIKSPIQAQSISTRG